MTGKDVVPVDLATGKTGRPITVPFTPVAVLVSPDGRLAYAFGLGNSEVIPIDLATRRVGMPIDLPPGGTDGAVLSPDGKWLYVTIGEHGFVIVDLLSGRPVATLDVPGGVGDIVLNSTGTMAYVDATSYYVEKAAYLSGGGDDVTAIDLADRAIVHVFRLPDTAIVLGISNDDKTLYLAESPSSGTPASLLYRVDLSTDVIARGVPMSSNLSAFLITPSGQSAYIDTDESHLAPLDLDTLSAGAPIEVGQDPGPGFFADHGDYLVIATDGGVVVVDLVDNHVFPPIPLPASGSGLLSKDHGAIGVTLVPGS